MELSDRPITARQHEVLLALGRLIRVHGYPPTLRELARAIGVGTSTGARKHLDALVRKGYLKRDPVARGLKLTPLGQNEVMLYRGHASTSTSPRRARSAGGTTSGTRRSS